MSLSELPRNHFGVILADPPWTFLTRSDKGKDRSAEQHYQCMGMNDIMSLPVADLAAPDCVLFIWATWPTIRDAFRVIDAWGFTYKTCGFDWMKADGQQIDMFEEPRKADMKMGYWTRSNSEPCLLATRGSPKRLSAGVRMGIIEKARQHSRKPDCVHGRIQELVAGPYLELFGRAQKPSWTVWGNQTDKFTSIPT